MRPWPRHIEPWQGQPGNGCGPAPKWINRLVPELMYRGACDEHDWYYRQGGRLRDKLRADLLFLWRLLCAPPRWWQRVYLWPVAMLYTAAVLYYGWFAFNWRRIDD